MPRGPVKATTSVGLGSIGGLRGPIRFALGLETNIPQSPLQAHLLTTVQATEGARPELTGSLGLSYRFW